MNPLSAAEQRAVATSIANAAVFFVFMCAPPYAFSIRTQVFLKSGSLDSGQ